MLHCFEEKYHTWDCIIKDIVGDFKVILTGKEK